MQDEQDPAQHLPVNQPLPTRMMPTPLVTSPALSGRLLYGRFTLRVAGSGTRLRPVRGSCIGVVSGDRWNCIGRLAAQDARTCSTRSPLESPEARGVLLA